MQGRGREAHAIDRHAGADLKAGVEAARALIGENAAGAMSTDRSTLDYLRVFASRAGVIGMPR